MTKSTNAKNYFLDATEEELRSYPIPGVVKRDFLLIAQRDLKNLPDEVSTARLTVMVISLKRILQKNKISFSELGNLLKEHCILLDKDNEANKILSNLIIDYRADRDLSSLLEQTALYFAHTLTGTKLMCLINFIKHNASLMVPILRVGLTVIELSPEEFILEDMLADITKH